MGTFSLGHWLVVLLVVLIVFGAGRLPKTMGELAKGVRAFRAGMREENAEAAESLAAPTSTTPAVEARAADRIDSRADSGGG